MGETMIMNRDEVAFNAYQELKEVLEKSNVGYYDWPTNNGFLMEEFKVRNDVFMFTLNSGEMIEINSRYMQRDLDKNGELKNYCIYYRKEEDRIFGKGRIISFENIVKTIKAA